MVKLAAWLRPTLARFGKREKALALVAVVMAVVVLMDRLAIRPYMDHKEAIKERLETKQELFKRCLNIVAKERNALTQAQKARKAKHRLAQRFLSADTEALASAKLQKIVKEIAANSNVTVTSSSSSRAVLLSKRDKLLLLPARFELRAGTMRAVRDFLWHVEYNPKTLLFVDKLYLRLLRKEEGVRISMNLNALVLIKK